MESGIPRWSEKYGFFGDFYIHGDNSVEGYLIDKKQNLQQRTTEEVNGILLLTQAKPGDTLLDCPCGYGRHSNELAKRGILVTGSDINSIHLLNAKEISLHQKIPTIWKLENMIDIDYQNEFDVVINMFYSFGFFENDQENEKVLSNFYNALKPGGRFLMHTDVNIPRILQNKYKVDEMRTLADGKKLRIIDNYNPKTKRIEGSRTIIDSDGNQEQKKYSVRVYTKEEFTAMCLKIGFTKVETFSDWNGNIYSESAEDMIIIATK